MIALLTSILVYARRAELPHHTESPTVVFLGEGVGHRGHLRRMVDDGQATGNRVHDAHIAALLL